MKRKLRSGYTTGACAAAAAKGAVELLFSGIPGEKVNIPFPDGSRVSFNLESCSLTGDIATCSVKKDAGDDPDVTNKALIVARVFVKPLQSETDGKTIIVTGGEGVGRVTKPGLSVDVGASAINPVPMKMIVMAVNEAVSYFKKNVSVNVEISVPQGKELAKKTLNRRLGIVGGISILGTTGIVKPISAEAWTATISTSMDVATAVGVREIILSTGRTSERCVQEHLQLSDEALVMMGDYLVFSLKETKKHSFSKIHVAAMWAKLMKGAMRVPQTHVRHGALDVQKAIQFFTNNGVSHTLIKHIGSSNTAREILEKLLVSEQVSVIDLVCERAKEYYSEIAEREVTIHLVHGNSTLLRTI